MEIQGLCIWITIFLERDMYFFADYIKSDQLIPLTSSYREKVTQLANTI